MNVSNAMRFTVLLFVLLLSCSQAKAQQPATSRNEVTVGTANVYREGRTLVIEYDISLGQDVASCDVELLISLDGGRNFSLVPETDNLAGDLGRITESGHKTIIYDIESIKSQLAGKQLAFKVNVRNKKKAQDDKGHIFVMGTGSTLSMFGLKTGYIKKFGGYISFSDTFSGKHQGWAVKAGGMVKAASWLYPYVGVGYGQLHYHNNFRYELSPFEAGTIFKIGQVSLSASVEPVYVWYEGPVCSFEFGVGLCF